MVEWSWHAMAVVDDMVDAWCGCPTWWRSVVRSMLAVVGVVPWADTRMEWVYHEWSLLLRLGSDERMTTWTATRTVSIVKVIGNNTIHSNVDASSLSML